LAKTPPVDEEVARAELTRACLAYVEARTMEATRMHRDVHSAALRATARVAFSVVFLGGCSAAVGALADADDGTYGADGENGASTEDAVRSKSKRKTGKDASAADATAAKPCDEKDASKPRCETVLASAFGDAGFWPDPDAPPASDEVKSCCIEAIAASMSSEAPSLGRSITGSAAAQPIGARTSTAASAPHAPPGDRPFLRR
jgi:hypothetical protein